MPIQSECQNFNFCQNYGQKTLNFLIYFLRSASDLQGGCTYHVNCSIIMCEIVMGLCPSNQNIKIPIFDEIVAKKLCKFGHFSCIILCSASYLQDGCTYNHDSSIISCGIVVRLCPSSQNVKILEQKVIFLRSKSYLQDGSS